MSNISGLYGSWGALVLSCLCVVASGCERATVTPPLQQGGGDMSQVAGQGPGDMEGGEEVARAREPVQDESGHGEDKPSGELSEQGPYHGFWSAMITRVETPAADPREVEADDAMLAGKPFLSFELTQARDAVQGGGSFVMGAGSGAGGVGGSFDEVSYSTQALRLRWKVGEGEKPYMLTTVSRLDEDHYEAVISSEFDPAGLRYIISLERLPATVNTIEPDPL